MSDLLLDNARIWTGTGSTASAMLLSSGRVRAFDAQARQMGAPHVIDIGGRTIAPGLIDAHVHLLMAGMHLQQLDLSNVNSRDAFETAIARQHESLPPGHWLLAHSWSQQRWGDADGEPDKSWLAAAENRPVVAFRSDLHVALVNDAVLSQCDLRSDPAGGEIRRNARGEPTGLMIEAAAWHLVNPLIPQPDAARKQQSLRNAQQYAHARGITAVGSMEYATDLLHVFEPLRNELTLRSRITLLDRNWPMDCDFAKAYPNDALLAVIGYKAFVDGTLGSRTARLLREYADDPGNRGMLIEFAANGHLGAWASRVAEAGLSPAMHAIGDEAMRIALDAIDCDDPAVRPRIEHAQQIDPADMQRCAGRILSMQPLHRADDGCIARARLGDERLAGCFAFASLVREGALLAFGSDWPVVDCDPLAGIRAAVTGRTRDGNVFQPHESLTVEQALHAYTAGAAHALQMDDAGVLAVGSHADAVVFDRDPFAANWTDNPPRITMTIVGGKVVYDSAQISN